MAGAVVSAVAERIIDLLKEQALYHVNLVRGAEKDVRSLAEELTAARDVLDDAERRAFEDGRGDGRIKDWLSRLEQACHEMDYVLDEWKYAILKLQIENPQSEGAAVAAPPNPKVCCFFIPSPSCLSFQKDVRRDIAKRLRNVKAKLDHILEEIDRYHFVISQLNPDLPPFYGSWRFPSSSITQSPLVEGRKFDRDILVTKLVGDGSRREELGIQVVSIVGVGGLGKTSLAQFVYNDSQVKHSFELRIWVCVSDTFDLASIAKVILVSMRRWSPNTTDQLDVLFEHVSESISGKRFLLVLDDVCTVNYLKWGALETSLRCGGAGSKILVTTRNENVARIMGTADNDVYHLGVLSDEDCWLLLRQTAHSRRNDVELDRDLENIAKKIAEKCHGLPLAAKVLGNLLRLRRSSIEWENVLESQIWQLEVAERELFPHFLLSYNKFSPVLKRCFSYCAVFPKGSEIFIEDLIGNWMALGYLGTNNTDMDQKGRTCFEELAMHSLFRDLQKGLNGQIRSCKMHDIMHDFVQYLRKRGRAGAAASNNSTCGDCNPSLTSMANEFCSLSLGYSDDDVPLYICDCLKHLRVLSVLLKNSQSIPRGIEKLIYLKWLNLDGFNLSLEDLEIIFQLYNLQTLKLRFCHIQEIPCGIGNLIQLRCLDLSDNSDLKELPESICFLKELRTLKFQGCRSLVSLPEGIHELINLNNIHYDTFEVNGLGNLGRLKKLNLFGGTLLLKISLADDSLEDVVADARKEDLGKSKYIERLGIEFEDEMRTDEGSSRRRSGLIDALKPPTLLQELSILSYKGPQLPAWMQGSDFNHLRKIGIMNCDYISSLLPLAKLQFLEEAEMFSMFGLKSVGREFLGITTTIGGGDTDIQPASNSTVAFPKLKKLTFRRCPNWKEWEDITPEEEKESAAISFMPCLTHLTLKICKELMELPHRLLHKVSSLEVLDLSYSENLQQRYGGKDSCIGINPHLQVICTW